MGAVAMKQPAFALNETEAKRLAVAIQAVQAEYPLVIDRKTQAWLNLAAIGGMVYVPRVIALANAPKAARKVKAETPSPIAPQTSPDISAGTIAPENPAGFKGPLTPAQMFGPGMAGG